MASTHDLTTEQGLSAYLTSTGIDHASVEMLTGWTANYVYRVTLRSGATTIYKHAAPYLHSNAPFAFNPKRMDYENRVLEILPPLLEKRLPESNVDAVRILGYDHERKLLNIEDGGARNLKEAYADASLDIPAIGRDLGRWLAGVHTATTSTSLALTPASTSASSSDDQGQSRNNEIAVSVYRYAYSNLHTAFTAYGQDVDLAHRTNLTYGAALAKEDECVLHGDFWPGNILLHSEREGKGVKMTVVDWEMTRRGTSATDVGQFCAETFLLDRFRGGRGLLSSFLDAYLGARRGAGGTGGGREMGREWFGRMAAHFGVHLAFWPTKVAWTDGEGTGELVRMGAEVLRAAEGEDWERLFELEPMRSVDAKFR